MVKLFTNAEEFYNDIAEVIRLFCDAGEVPLSNEADADVHAVIEDKDGKWCATAYASSANGGFQYSYSMDMRRTSRLVEKREKKRCIKIAAFRALKMAYPDAFVPWGSLTGIRPTRLLRELIDDMGEDEAMRFMRSEFDVSEKKLALASEIVRVQQPVFATQTPSDIDVYVGIPFCRTRCLYCSFLAEVRTKKTDMASYIEALKRDITLGADTAKKAGLQIRSMYVGGGTPTVLTERELDDVLTHAVDAYGGFGTELTVEAGRPDTITREKLTVMKRIGAGRISINPQSMNDRTLELIGRSHSSDEIVRAYGLAREIGFESVNMDVITGLPGEEVGDVVRTLEAIERLAPENLTVHTLAIKRSSLLKSRLEEYPLKDAATVDSMVNAGSVSARRMGMRPYYMYRQKYMRGNLENVGYAMPGTECVYNVDMMEETTSIMAHGAGAISKCIYGGEHRVERVPNPKDIVTYINKLDTTDAARRALYGV